MTGAVLRLACAVVLSAIAGCSQKPVPSPPPIESIDLPTRAASGEPTLAAASDRLVAGWIETDAGVPVFRIALRDGAGWSEPRTVTRDPDLLVNWTDTPAIAALGDGTLAALWTLRLGESSTRILAAISRDDGRTWSAPACPHGGPSSERGLATIVPETAATFSLLWLDARAAAPASAPVDAPTALYRARWNGTAFDREELIDDRVCDCCRIGAVATDRGLFVAYRDRSAVEIRDISVLRHDATGWTSPVPVHDDGWKLKACPTNGPSIVAVGRALAVGWFSGAGAAPAVRAAFSADDGRTFSRPVPLDGGSPIGRVEAAALPDGSAAFVWLEKSGPASAEVRVRRLSADGRAGPAVTVGRTAAGRAAGIPRIVSVGAGRVAVAWTEPGAAGGVRLAALRPIL